MANKFIKKQLDFIVTNANITDIYEIDKIRYGLEVFINESLKFIIMFVIAVLLDKLSAFFVMITLLLLIRTHMGGSHSKSLLSCLVKSNVLFLSIYFIADKLSKLSILIQLLVVSINIFIVFKYKPINTLRRKVNYKYNKLQFKYIVIATLLFWTVYSNIFLSSYLLNCGFLIIIYVVFDYLKEVFTHEKINNI